MPKNKIIYNKSLYGYEIPDINVYFKFNNSLVYNLEKEKVTCSSLNSEKNTSIVILTKCKLEEYESPIDLAKHYRGQSLIIQGIITFFTGVPLTVYNKYDSHNICDLENKDIPENRYNLIQDYEQNTSEDNLSYLIIENEDLTLDLIKMLKRIEEEPQLIITLLDRWRKAIYLKNESHDADLYYDEAILNYFHIFELLGEHCSKSLKIELEKNIENMLNKHFDSMYLNKTQSEELVKQNKKTINSILIGDHLNLSIKIKYFLEKHELLDDNVSFFVDEMIKIRNQIAHGRISYREEFLYPLPPFFNLAKDSYENIEILFHMTGVMISKYIGINCWQNEWEDTKVLLLPPKYIVENFLNNKLIIENFNSNMLFDGNKYNLTWNSIFNHYIKNPKKEFLKAIEKKLKQYYIEIDVSEINAQYIFNVSLLFADSYDDTLKTKSIANIKLIIENKWCTLSDFKESYEYLKFYKVDLVWCKEFLENRDYFNI